MVTDLPVLLMTRPRASAERFVAALRSRGAIFRDVNSPLFDIVFSDDPVDPEGARGLIFTSANGVAAWKARGRHLILPTYVVGPATAQAARAAGLPPEMVCADADHLVRFILDTKVQGPLLHLSGRNTRGDIAERLTRGGIPTERAIVYDQPACSLNQDARAVLDGDVPVVAPVFSPRSGHLLANQPNKAPLLVAAMSEAVAFAVTPLHIESLKVAERPDSAAMLETVLELLGAARTRMEGSGSFPGSSG